MSSPLKTLCATLGLALGLPGEPTPYFPLQVGNRWEYRCTGECAAGTLTREIVGTERRQPQDVLYYVMRESGVEYRLRSDEQGRVLVLDPQTGTEKQWYAFGTREGEEYETAINRCNPSAQVASRAATYHGPGGDISNALRIAYTSTCNFAGLQEETFAVGIGLLQRIENVGTAQFDLLQARVNGASVTLRKALAFEISVDRTVYPKTDTASPPAEMDARLRLRNTTGDAVDLLFPTAQRQDFIVRNPQGVAVLQWSEGKTFAQVTATEHVTGEVEYGAAVSLIGRSGEPLSEGRYTWEGWLTTDSGQFSATVAFEIRCLAANQAAITRRRLWFPRIRSISESTSSADR